MEDWRVMLYPLGFLSNLAFGARFIVQWLQSELKGRSVIHRSFWQLSLLGNLLLAFHSFIQIQYHVCLIQVCNGIIAYRNLDLMRHDRPPLPLKKVLQWLALGVFFTSLSFLIQNIVSIGQWNATWFRLPSFMDMAQHHPVSWIWHAFGFLGYLLFSSRFWVQWWEAEKAQASRLELPFWWLSLSGAVLSLLYFFYIRDPVNLIGPLIGLIPYIRNLMLIYKAKGVAKA